MNISEAIEQFLTYQKTRRGRTETTIITYRSMLGLFANSVGDIAVSCITLEMIDQYADKLQTGGLKPKSIKNRLTAIRSFIAYLYSRSYVNIRPQAIDIPITKEIEANFLDFDEQNALISACTSQRDRAIVLLIIRSGLRVSELIDLRSDDIFDRSVVVRCGKGQKPRVTFITEDADEAVRLYHDSFKKLPEWCFPAQSGEKLSRQYVHRIIVTAATSAGIKKKVSPHTLRHTFATNMLRSGARVEDIQPMMGHSNIRTTLIYMHFTNDYLKQRYDEISCGKLLPQLKKTLDTSG